MKTLTFKQLVENIAALTPGDEEKINTVCGMINRSYENEKISFKDHENLFKIASSYYR